MSCLLSLGWTTLWPLLQCSSEATSRTILRSASMETNVVAFPQNVSPSFHMLLFPVPPSSTRGASQVNYLCASSCLRLCFWGNFNPSSPSSLCPPPPPSPHSASPLLFAGLLSSSQHIFSSPVYLRDRCCVPRLKEHEKVRHSVTTLFLGSFGSASRWRGTACTRERLEMG